MGDAEIYGVVTPAAIQQQISREDIDVVSFDIFDTLLLRPFSDPADIFRLMQKDFEALTGDSRPFLTLRKQAESQARSLSGRREDVTLQEIYRCMAQHCTISEEIGQQLMALEIFCELRWIQPRPSGAALLDYAKACGKRIVLISDMYLPAQTVEAMLRQCGLTGWERIFISGEVGLVKTSGHLFQYAAQTLKTSPKKMLHIGDSPLSDGESAQWTGLAACVHPRPMKRLHTADSPDFCESGTLADGCLQTLTANRFLDLPFQAENAEALIGYAALGPWMLAGSVSPAPIDAAVTPVMHNAAQDFLRDWNALTDHSNHFNPPASFTRAWSLMQEHAVLPVQERAELLLCFVASLRAPCHQDQPVQSAASIRRLKYMLYRFPRLRKAMAGLLGR